MEQAGVVQRTTAEARRWWQADYRENLTREQALKGWIAERIRYPEIASRLGTTTGSICGKVSRLGIGQGAVVGRYGHRLSPGGVSSKADEECLEILAQQQAEAEQSKAWVGLIDLQEHNCRFVLGEPKDGHHCGLDRLPGLPYCRRHAERCVAGRSAARAAA